MTTAGLGYLETVQIGVSLTMPTHSTHWSGPVYGIYETIEVDLSSSEVMIDMSPIVTSTCSRSGM